MNPADRAQVAAWLESDAMASLAADTDTLTLRIEAARREGLSGLLCERWRAIIAFDDPRAALLSAEIGRQVASELIRSGAERRVLAALGAAGIDVLVLKGAALARWLYPQAHWRPRSDLDLLFASEADSARAEQVLATLGYRWDGILANGPCVERTCVGTQHGVMHSVDLHWRLTPHPAYADRFSFDELRGKRVPLPSLPDSYGLGAMHALVHAALHRLANRWVGEEDRVVWLYDLHLLARRMDPDAWSTLVDCACTHGVAAPLVDALHRSSEWLGTPIPDDAMRRLVAAAATESFQVEDAQDRRVFEWHALRRLPPGPRLAQAWRLLFPSVAYMRQRYRVDSPVSITSAYVRRVVDGLKLLFKA